MEKAQLSVQDAVTRVERHIRIPDETTNRPVLIMMTGLPGTGKSHVSKLIQEALPSAIVQSDFVRKLLFRRPRYTAEESDMVYQTCHEVVSRLLNRGIRVIFDATNLIEHKREIIYNIAERTGAKLIIVRTVAPKSVVVRRLEHRGQGTGTSDLSDADITVYERMLAQDEPIRRRYFTVDTSQDLKPIIEKIVREAAPGTLHRNKRIGAGRG